MSGAVSPVRLLVLGVVRNRGQAHGYQVSRELLSWRADYWARVRPGSIYQALRTLAKHGLLTEVGTESGDSGPDRVVYQITPDGENELLHLIRLSLSDPETGSQALNAAFAMLDHLDHREVASLLGYRVRALRGRLQPSKPDVPDRSDSPPEHVEALIDLYIAQTHTEIEWASAVTDQIRRDELGLDGGHRVE